jgi:thiamine biosynthesis lipoprotein
MGTTWRLRLAAPPACDARALHAAIAMRLAEIVAEMSHWQPESVLVRFNRATPASWLPLPSDFATVMATALDIARRSNGAFDPTLGALVDLWGYGPPGPQPAPSPDAVATARAATGWQALQFDPAARRLRQPGGVRLDLSGIAKGFAVDAVARLLEQAGHAHFLIEIGGELAGRGIRPDGEPWWVDLETPPGTLPPLRVALHQIAVATSGDYVRGAHTIDPRTGHPCAGSLATVSVLHPSAMQADAWASALTVLGPDAGLALAEAEGLAVRMIDRAAPAPRELLSSALAAML